jgi:hypothetical protein
LWENGKTLLLVLNSKDAYELIMNQKTSKNDLVPEVYPTASYLARRSHRLLQPIVCNSLAGILE